MERPTEKKYTYADYAGWDDGQRYELIDGEVYMMSPSPSPVHQEISVNLVGQLYTYLKGKTCRVYAAPFDVRLFANAQDDTVVQPDITVICDLSRIDASGLRGAPDMVVEILSPTSARHDQITKFNLYRRAGVREYWVVNPDARGVQVHLLREGEYISRAYSDTDSAPVSVLEACTIDLSEVFPEAPPEEAPKGP